MKFKMFLFCNTAVQSTGVLVRVPMNRLPSFDLNYHW